MIYVMSDIHGCYEEFMKMLEKIKFSEKDELYIVGDVVDRGPDPIKVMQYTMACKNIHLIRGNHEQMMYDALTDPRKESSRNIAYYRRSQHLWDRNGGGITFEQYNTLSEAEKVAVYEYIEKLPAAKLLEVNEKKYLLVHGSTYSGIEEDITYGHITQDALWERPYLGRTDPDLTDFVDFGIFGHTPTINYGDEYEGKIIRDYNKILIDGGCVFGYSLICLCLNNDEVFYIFPHGKATTTK